MVATIYAIHLFVFVLLIIDRSLQGELRHTELESNCETLQLEYVQRRKYTESSPDRGGCLVTSKGGNATIRPGASASAVPDLRERPLALVFSAFGYWIHRKHVSQNRRLRGSHGKKSVKMGGTLKS